MASSARWIGRKGPVLWSPRSPDFISSDFSPMGQYQGIGVLRQSDYTRLHAACTSVSTVLVVCTHPFHDALKPTLICTADTLDIRPLFNI
ncbi:hypothetical protein TNCV_5050391 [Trichonephila clavipes]|nr:hypothetical protein TNCV_5050391 [Trichonephila clavipes]